MPNNEVEWGILVLVTGFIFGIAWLIVAFVKDRKARKHNALSLTHAYGGRWVADGWGGGHVEFQVDGVPGQLGWFLSHQRSNPEHTRIVFQRPFSGRLRVLPTGGYRFLRKLLGAELLEIGDPSFDLKFEIESTSPEFARSILTPEVKRILAGQVNQHEINLDIIPGAIAVAAERYLTAPRDLQSFFDGCVSLIYSLRRSESIGEMVLQVEVAKGDCLTCGSPLDEASPPCAKCGTRMHRDCWGYFGSCATYGCGGNVS